jgi:hypothetical protein
MKRKQLDNNNNNNNNSTNNEDQQEDQGPPRKSRKLQDQLEGNQQEQEEDIESASGSDTDYDDDDDDDETQKYQQDSDSENLEFDISEYLTASQTRTKGIVVGFCDVENEAWIEQKNAGYSDEHGLFLTLLRYGVFQPKNVNEYYRKQYNDIRECIQELKSKKRPRVGIAVIEKLISENFDKFLDLLTKVNFAHAFQKNSTLLQCSNAIVHKLLKIFPILAFRGLKTRAKVEHFVSAATGSLRVMNLIGAKIYKKFSAGDWFTMLSRCADIKENKFTVNIFKKIPKKMLNESIPLMDLFFENAQCVELMKPMFTENKNLALEVMNFGRLSPKFYQDELMQDSGFLDRALEVNGFYKYFQLLPRSVMEQEKVLFKFAVHDIHFLQKIPHDILIKMKSDGILMKLVVFMVQNNRNTKIPDIDHCCKNIIENEFFLKSNGVVHLLSCACEKFLIVVAGKEHSKRILFLGEQRFYEDPEISYLRSGYRLPRTLTRLNDIKFKFK